MPTLTPPAPTALDDLHPRFQALAKPDETWDQFVVTAVREAVERREREAARWAAARAEAQAILNGPRRPFAEANEEFRRKHNIPDLSHLSREELEEQAEAALAALPHDKIIQAAHEGLL